MAVGILVLTYVQKHKHKWSHYLPIMGEFSFWPLDDMFVLAPNRKRGHWNIKLFYGRKIYFDLSSGRGSNFHPTYE